MLSIEQTTESEEENGLNVITATLSDGQVSTFRLRNGSDGKDGADGADGAPGADGKDGQDGKDGKDGKDGQDGTRFEFIYKRVADESVVVVKPSNAQVDKYEPEGWTDNPKGVTDDLCVEYVCQREKINDV